MSRRRGRGAWLGLPLLTVVGILAFVGFLIAEIILLTDPGSGTSITENPRIVLISLGIFFGPDRSSTSARERGDGLRGSTSTSPTRRSRPSSAC